MDSMTDMQRYTLTGIMLLALVGVICWVFYLLEGKSRFVKWRERRRLAAHTTYMSDLMHEYTDTGLHFALLEREIAERIGTAPPEFVPPLIKVIKVVRASQQALFAKAKELDLYDPELAGEEQPPTPEPVVVQEPPPPPPAEEPELRKVGLRVVGSLAWDKDGHLVPK